MRRTLIGGLLIGLGMLAWYLDGLLYDAAWVTNFTPDLKPDDIIRGWGILLAAWPLALVGVLVGGVVALVMFMLAYAYGQDEDHTREIERLQQVAIEAEQRAEQAEATALINATTALQQEQAVLQAQQVEAKQHIQLAESRWQAATKAITEVDQRIALITKERDEAMRKAANATATIRRHQAKAATK